MTEPFAVRIEGLENGAPVQTTVPVDIITRGLPTAHDWAEVERLVVEDAEIVLSNTGGTGFAVRPADALGHFDQSMSYPAKLTLLLRARYATNANPIQIMPMELVSGNGDVLKARVLELAQGDGFRAYLETDVIWVNSLVDRIVSRPI